MVVNGVGVESSSWLLLLPGSSQLLRGCSTLLMRSSRAFSARCLQRKFTITISASVIAINQIRLTTFQIQDKIMIQHSMLKLKRVDIESLPIAVHHLYKIYHTESLQMAT